jgi:hypothetical protein
VENICHVLNSFWSSERAVANAVSFLDYAGIIDVVAAVILLIIWIFKPPAAMERRLTLFTILFSLFAGLLWVADSTFGHRLTVLQTAQSNDRADAAEKAKDAAVQAAAVAASMADSAKEDASKLHPRTITPEQYRDFVTILANAPKKPVWVAFDNSSAERLAEQVRGMLDDAGYSIPHGSLMARPHVAGIGDDGLVKSIASLHTAVLPEDTFIALAFNAADSSNGPPHGIALLNAFRMVHVQVTTFPTKGLIESGEVVIIVPAKQQF